LITLLITKVLFLIWSAKKWSHTWPSILFNWKQSPDLSQQKRKLVEN